MRHQNRTLLEKLKEQYGPFQKVLEVGSREVDGKVRDIFEGSDYTGLDLFAGTGVDVVMDAHDMTYKDEFDLVICVDTLEHDSKFWVTVEKIKDAVKPGGFMCLAAPSRYCPEHDWPGDYWRFMPQSFKEFFKDWEDVYIETQRNEQSLMEDEIAGWGRKP